MRAIAAELGVAGHTALPRAPLRVRDLMTAAPIVLHTEQSLLSATLVLVHHHIAGAPVIDESGTLVGVLSEATWPRRDVLRALTRTAEQLQHVVERTLEQLGEPGMHVTVDAGSRVQLTGAVADPKTAGYAGHLAAAVAGSDG